MGLLWSETQPLQIDADVLKKIIIKLQKRVQAGAATLLVQVKAHRGDPLNEEADIRAEIGCLKEQKEVTLDNPTNRTIYQWSVTPSDKKEDQSPDQRHGPTRLGIDSAKQQGKLRHFGH